MALPTTIIYLNSPYWIQLNRSSLEKMVIDVWVYTGTLTTDKPTDRTYRLATTAFYDSDLNSRSAQLDIAEFARDYVEVAYSGSDVSNAVWIEYTLYYADIGDTSLTQDSTGTITGLAGGGYFEDGYNPTPPDRKLMSSDYVIVPTGENATIPVLQDFLTGYTLYEEKDIDSPATIIEAFTGLTTTENTANVVRYVSTATNNGTPNSITLNYSGGKASQTLRIYYLDEDWDDAIKVSFVNRHGAIQNLWCFAKSQIRITTSEEKFKRNILEANTYSKFRHQNAILNKNGRMSITVNTGFYPENANGTFLELMLSERVWVTIPQGKINFNTEFNSTDLVAPALVKNSDFTFKTSRNDKLINYTFDLEFANDKINSVR